MRISLGGIALDEITALVDGVPDPRARIESAEVDGSTRPTAQLW